MDARLDTLSTELYQVNIHVGRIAWWQAVIGSLVSETSPPPTPEASDDEDDGDASSSSANEMSTWHSYPLSLVTKRESSFGYESNHS